MRFTNFMIRPQQHKWESSIAYLLRLSSLNGSNFKALVKDVLHKIDVGERRPFGIEGCYQPGEYQRIKRCLNVAGKLPLRWICKQCLQEEQPDFYKADIESFVEFCFMHDCLLTKICQRCDEPLRYGFKNFFYCKCGQDLRDGCRKEDKYDVLHLYKAVAANVPLGVEVSQRDFEKFNFEEIENRLEMTWGLITSDGMYANSLTISSFTDQPLKHGDRWKLLARLLGPNQSKLCEWALHLGCWTRYTSNENLYRSYEPIDERLIPWRYLYLLLENARSKGCSGPSIHECVAAGKRCKSNKMGIKGDPFPSEIGTFLMPTLGESVEMERGVLHFSRSADDLKDSEGMDEIFKGISEVDEVALQLVGLGVLQPLELIHPKLWRFERGAVMNFLKKLVSQIPLIDSIEDDVRNLKARKYKLRTYLRKSTIGMLIHEANFAQDLHVLKAERSIWNTTLSVSPLWCVRSKNMRPQIELYNAVEWSLNPYARKAAIVANCYLGYSAELTRKELEMYCGYAPVLKGVLPSRIGRYKGPGLWPSIPQKLLWDGAQLKEVCAN